MDFDLTGWTRVIFSGDCFLDPGSRPGHPYRIFIPSLEYRQRDTKEVGLGLSDRVVSGM